MRVDDRSIEVTELPMLVWVAAVALLIAPIGAFVLLAGGVDLLGFGLPALGWIVLLIALHEGVHALFWKLASGLPWSDFTFGVMWKTLSPYCHARKPMSVRAYRIGAAAPLFLAGFLPWILALWMVSGQLAIGASLMISGAVGDLYVLWTLRDLPAAARVQDHEKKVGCLVFLQEPGEPGS